MVFICTDTVLAPVPTHVRSAVVCPFASVAAEGWLMVGEPVPFTTMLPAATPDLGLRQVSRRVIVTTCGVLITPLALPVIVLSPVAAETLPADTVTVGLDTPLTEAAGSLAVKVTPLSALYNVTDFVATPFVKLACANVPMFGAVLSGALVALVVQVYVPAGALYRLPKALFH